jgi:two-component system, chemotaxis family, protein-glutamate methylesterase/glutaminase
MTLVLAVVGASWGGAQALPRLLSGLPEDIGMGVAVVQHRAAGSDERTFARYLERHCRLPVSEAVDKEPIRPGHVVLAPGGYHLLAEVDCYSLSVEEPVNRSRPSIDVLFETAARSLGPGVVSVLLTGTGRDGTAGTLAVAAAGGITVAQDPDEAEGAEMPRSAVASGAVMHVLPLDAIAPLLVRLDQAVAR